MKSMIEENPITFKEIEQEIFRYHNEEAARDAQAFLESYDEYLFKTRDKKKYRDKGKRKTTVKTVFGEVYYSRHVYESQEDDGTLRYVYLLDETLNIKSVGAISQNYAEKLVSGITTKSYRNCAKEVSETTGQSISAMGVWNVIQAIGEDIVTEEHTLVKQNKAHNLKGERQAPVLFEEADGVNIRLQGKDRKKYRKGQAEMKVAIAYDGWKETGNKRYKLDGKVSFAGFTSALDFHQIREAKIAAEYDLVNTQLRVLNADGAGWIKKVPDPSTCFQLDPFHRNKAIRENIPYPEIQKDLLSLLQKGAVEKAMEYLTIYRDSLLEDDEIEQAEGLIRYFKNNEEGLLAYQKREAIPESPKGLEYKNLGTMENHIWSIIASRMKHNHTTWSIRGGNNLAKVLAKKSEGKLYEVTEKLKEAVFEKEKTQELINDILRPRQVPWHEGKGSEYTAIGHLPILDSPIRGDQRKAFLMAGY